MSGSDGGAALVVASPSSLLSTEGDFVIDNLEEFKVIEKRIEAADDVAQAAAGDSVRDRWESGRLILTKMVGRKLPVGLLEALEAELGTGRKELQFRKQFAEKCPTEDALSTAVDNYGSWTQIKANMSKIGADPKSVEKKGSRAELPGGSRNPKLIARARELVESGEALQAPLRDEFGVSGGVATAARNYVLGLIEGENKILDATAQQRKDALEAKLRRQLNREYQDKRAADIAELRAEAAKAVEDYKAQVDADMAASRERMTAERDRYKTAVAAIQAEHGIFTAGDYKTILSCLHPDSRSAVSDEKLASAFRIFNDPKIKVLLVKE